MIRKHTNYRWEGVDILQYKEDGSIFRDVTRQVLFENDWDLPCQWRYFEVGVGGYSTLEKHEHTHWVMIIRGKGTCLLGNDIREVGFGDAIRIPSWQWHQFKANRGESLGFLCLVSYERDKVTLPTESDIAQLKKNPEIKRFLEECGDG